MQYLLGHNISNKSRNSKVRLLKNFKYSIRKYVTQILFYIRVFRRFCEIQDIPHRKTRMTYDELRQIVAKYQDLCKCPELKVSTYLLMINPLHQLKPNT